MCKSCCHKTVRGLIAHHLNPLHVCSLLIIVGKKKKGVVKAVCFAIVAYYDKLYRLLPLR